MQEKIYGCALDSLQATTVTIELSLEKGNHRVISGLPDDAVKESLARIEAAITNAGFRVPDAKMVYCLSPACLPKKGTILDLPMAISMLAASGQLPGKKRLKDFIICGELNLSGEVLPIRGALSVALHAWREKISGVIVPAANVDEAALVTKIPVYGVHTLEETIQFLSGQLHIEPVTINTREIFYNTQYEFDVDFSEVRGNAHAKRGMEISASGSHGVLLIGSPGSAKSMTAARLPTILPPMTLQEALEITEIMSVFGDGGKIKQGLISRRPFIAGNSTISIPGLIGGGSVAKPGLITLAHNGVLFLDEFAEFGRPAIESLRLPIEMGEVKITRAMNTVTFPSAFILVAATNACPCGYFNHPQRNCSCSPKTIQKYLNKLSGPIMDRLPLHIEVQPVSAAELIGESQEESSSAIRERVMKAREIQNHRFKPYDKVHNNSQMTAALVKMHCKLETDAEELLVTAMRHLKLSGRGYDSILKVSRTIADLEGSEIIRFIHISEAIGYRSLDKEKWMATASGKAGKHSGKKTVFKVA